MDSISTHIRARVTPLHGRAGGRYAPPTHLQDQQRSLHSDITDLRIMIVEDSDAVHAVLYDMVTRIAGLSVAASFGGVSTAMAGIRSDPPDIVLLDIQLQGENSMEVMQLVAESHFATKVIVVTNHTDAIYRRYYANAGAYAFFDKSHELKTLRHTLEKLAASRGNTEPTGSRQAVRES